MYNVISSQSKKRKLLKWFEEVFIHVSGEDQPIQVDQFTAAIHTDQVSGFHSESHILKSAKLMLIWPVGMSHSCHVMML